MQLAGEAVLNPMAIYPTRRNACHRADSVARLQNVSSIPELEIAENQSSEMELIPKGKFNSERHRHARTLLPMRNAYSGHTMPTVFFVLE
jgi:hypothetical protein